jgi:hypothetical protein
VRRKAFACCGALGLTTATSAPGLAVCGAGAALAHRPQRVCARVPIGRLCLCLSRDHVWRRRYHAHKQQRHAGPTAGGCGQPMPWLAPATSAPGLGSPLPHLHRDSAHRCHICTGTRLTAATSAPGLGSLLPHLCARGLGSPPLARRRFAAGVPTNILALALTCVGSMPLDAAIIIRCVRCARAHICTGTGLTPPTSAPRLRSPPADPAGRHGHTIRCSALHTAGRVLGARVGVWSGCVRLHTHGGSRQHSAPPDRSTSCENPTQRHSSTRL